MVVVNDTHGFRVVSRANVRDASALGPANAPASVGQEGRSGAPAHSATRWTRVRSRTHSLEEHQPGSGSSIPQDSADSAKANTRHGLAHHGAHPHSILRISQTIDESTKLPSIGAQRFGVRKGPRSADKADGDVVDRSTAAGPEASPVDTATWTSGCRSPHEEPPDMAPLIA